LKKQGGSTPLFLHLSAIFVTNASIKEKCIALEKENLLSEKSFVSSCSPTPEILSRLRLTDYLTAGFAKGNQRRPLNLPRLAQRCFPPSG
jgi:hypothetical protein